MKQDSPYLVLGGGVCGLYAALTLLRRGVPVTVLEKQPRVGGLAASVDFAGNPIDFGVHMLHGFDTELRDDLLGLMGDDAMPVPLHARIRWRNREFRYPLQFSDLLTALPPLELLRGTLGLLATGLRRRPPQYADAEAALIGLYGKPLYRSFFEDFTARYWGMHPRRLSASFVERKMPRLTAADALRRFAARLGMRLPSPPVESALLEETLYYSRQGSAGLPEAIAREIRRLGGELLTDAVTESLTLHDHGGGSVSYIHGDQRFNAPIRGCLSTIPLPSLVALLKPGPPARILQAAAGLRYRAMAVHALLVRRERCMDALYTYYRDRCFHRVAEPKNAGMPVVPAGHTVLLVERMCEPGDDTWRGSEDALAATVDDAVAENLFSRGELVNSYTLQARHAYPVFERGFEPQLDAVIAYINGKPALRTAGRQGTFSYPNMHRAMREGADAVADIA